MKTRIKDKLNKKIIDFLLTEDGAYYGNLVMELNEDTLTILEHLIDLKRKGLIYKDHEGGKFRLKEDLDPKPDERDVIDEQNHFSKKTHEKTKEIDNEVSINKQVPKEQNVDHHKPKE